MANCVVGMGHAVPPLQMGGMQGMGGGGVSFGGYNFVAVPAHHMTQHQVLATGPVHQVSDGWQSQVPMASTHHHEMRQMSFGTYQEMPRHIMSAMEAPRLNMAPVNCGGHSPQSGSSTPPQWPEAAFMANFPPEMPGRACASTRTRARALLRQKARSRRREEGSKTETTSQDQDGEKDGVLEEDENEIQDSEENESQSETKLQEEPLLTARADRQKIQEQQQSKMQDLQSQLKLKLQTETEHEDKSQVGASHNQVQTKPAKWIPQLQLQNAQEPLPLPLHSQRQSTAYYGIHTQRASACYGTPAASTAVGSSSCSSSLYTSDESDLDPLDEEDCETQSSDDEQSMPECVYGFSPSYAWDFPLNTAEKRKRVMLLFAREEADAEKRNRRAERRAEQIEGRMQWKLESAQNKADIHRQDRRKLKTDNMDLQAEVLRLRSENKRLRGDVKELLKGQSVGSAGCLTARATGSAAAARFPSATALPGSSGASTARGSKERNGHRALGALGSAFLKDEGRGAGDDEAPLASRLLSARSQSAARRCASRLADRFVTEES